MPGTLTTYILDTTTPLTMLLAERTGGITTRYWHGLDTLAQSDGTTTQHFTYDGLGSVRQLVGESGSVGLAHTFDPYGNGFSKAGSAGSSFGYSGEQVDANGFVYLRARYYNPAYGRFFQMDPSRQEKNAYQYGLSNPILHTDPSGLVVGPLKCAPLDLWCQLVTSNQSNQSGSVNLKMNLQLPPSLLSMNSCSGGQRSAIDDVIEGIQDQLVWDMLAVPVSTTIELTANMPGLSLHTRNVLMSHTADPTRLELQYWTGSDAYRLGRQVGRRISMGIGIILTAVGIVDTIAAFTIAVPTAAAGAACEVASGGACTPAAAAVWAIDVVAVGVGVTVAAYGGMILYASTGSIGGSDPTLKYGTNKGDTAKNARILRKNMVEAGTAQPTGGSAHHIVHSTDARAARARQMLQDWGIDINQAENGVLLTRSANSQLNSSVYIQKVADSLKAATSKSDAIAILDKIRQGILAGTFPPP